MYIQKNISNTVVLTLSEKQTSTIHDWLFEFTNDSTGEVKYCAALDSSAYVSRYNEFTITDSTTEDPYNGTLNFSPTGQWSYRVYEMPDSSPPALTTTGYLAICEEGMLIVYDSTENARTSYDEDENKSNAVYE